MNNNQLAKRKHHLGIINRAVGYITQNLDEDLSLNKVSEIAVVSPFHFHRIFTSLLDETLHDFVSRKRIEKIAESILITDSITLSELSMKYGFDSPSSFSRSFKQYYGISPSEMRRQSKGRFNKIVKEVDQSGDPTITIGQYINHVDQSRRWLMSKGNVEVLKYPAIKLASIRNKGPFEDVYNAFRRLKFWAASRDLAHKSTKWLMVIHDNPAVTEEHKMMQSACMLIETDISSDGEVIQMEIPEGIYLRGRFKLTEDSDFKKAWDGMSIWMFDNDFKPRDGYYFEMFHTESLFNPKEKHQVDIFIPIEG